MNTSSTDKINSIAKLKFHGTNGWFETENGKTSCTGIYSDDYNIILDIGTGFRDVKPEDTKDKPLFLFLSHLHLDHIYGIHLLSLHSPSMIKIFIPDELKNHFITISREPFIKSIDKLGFPVEISGLNEDWYREKYFNFQALALLHNSTTFSYRLDIKNKIICYCVDTKLCENVYAISKNADVFICDSALKRNDNIEGKFHMKIDDTFRVANESNVGMLILTHFGALRYKTLEERNLEAEALSDKFKNYVVAIDGMQISL